MNNEGSLIPTQVSIANVLVCGSAISPITLGVLQNHLEEQDPTAWHIILDRFLQWNQEIVNGIISQVMRTPGVQFSKRQLVNMLLSLPGGATLTDKLSLD